MRVYVIEMNTPQGGPWLPWEVYLSVYGALQRLAIINRHPGVCTFRINTYSPEVDDAL